MLFIWIMHSIVIVSFFCMKPYHLLVVNDYQLKNINWRKRNLYSMLILLPFLFHFISFHFLFHFISFLFLFISLSFFLQHIDITRVYHNKTFIFISYKVTDILTTQTKLFIILWLGICQLIILSDSKFVVSFLLKKRWKKREQKK